MTQLRIPDVSLQRSWAEAVAEYGEEFMHGSGLWGFENLDTTEEGCAAVVAHLLAQGDPATELPEGVRSGRSWSPLPDPHAFCALIAGRSTKTAN